MGEGSSASNVAFLIDLYEEGNGGYGGVPLALTFDDIVVGVLSSVVPGLVELYTSFSVDVDDNFDDGVVDAKMERSSSTQGLLSSLVSSLSNVS